MQGLAIACAMAFGVPAFAQDAQATAASSKQSCGHRAPGDTRPRIGLALGGGGARGIAHISVLREIEARRIVVDCIAGTSMGSLVGGLYASGMSVDAMEELVRSTDWAKLFDDKIPRPERSYRRKQDDRMALATVGVGINEGRLRVTPGVLQGTRILNMFEDATLGVSTVSDFDRLPIPFRAVATDLNTGGTVVLDHGSLAMAMRASMSLPGIFQPIQIGDHVLIDGGVANQVPVDVVRAMGADLVIAVDVGTPLETLDGDASLLQVISQMSGMLTVGNTQRMLATLGPDDILITPDLGARVKTGEFEKAGEALAIGAEAAAAARPRLAALSSPQATYAAAVEARPLRDTAPPVIEFVRVENHTPYADEYLREWLDIPVGEPVDLAKIERHVLRLMSNGTFASITYEIVREDERTGMLVRAREKPQGPNYVQLGLTVTSDFSGSYTNNLRAALLISPISKYGAEARIGAQLGNEPSLWGEYYRPLDVRNRWLFYTRLAYDNPEVNVFSGARNIATYDVRAMGIEARFAREYGNYGAAGIGYQRAVGEADLQTGDPQLPEFNFDTGRAFAFANVDRLDSLYFPRQGYGAELRYTHSSQALGSDSDYSQVDVTLLAAKAFGRHSVQFGGHAGVTFDGDLPLQELYRLGGRGRLAGFRPNELTGQDVAVVFVGYTYQLAEVFGRSALVGGTFEYGNAWQDEDDMDWSDGIFNASAYIGFDSWIGPMIFGYGWRESGDGVLFLEIGKPF